ncbi:hypothetical protein AMJ47_02265 [Parcubacteria bacterium DG_72]|nr:MAG: hypothetical protein AMJ47_02265 [Parcubacteria bacterium DG_72]
MRKIVFLISLLFLFLPFFALPAEAFSEGRSAQENIEINFFYSPTCPHCAEEAKFLDGIEEKYQEVQVNRFSATSKDNIDFLKNLYEEYNVPQSQHGLVPVTFIEDYYFVGFSSKTGNEIENCIVNTKNNLCEQTEEGINIPFLGKINVKKYSLPTLAVLLGVLDGFNVCSLGALVLILGLVLALKSRKKTLLFGGIFILTTAIIYGILIVAWYKLFSFFTSYMNLMHFLIAALGIGGGIYFLKQFLKFKKYGPTCEISAGKGLMTRFSSRFQESLQKSGNIILLLASILLFAAIITIIEFPCSAVVPVAFAGVLAQSNLSTFLYLFYIFIFVLFYMLDEIIVFLIAFFTMKVWLASSKAVTWINLAESIILFALGFYYLFTIFS